MVFNCNEIKIVVNKVSFKNTLKSALSRHLQDLGRNKDIVMDKKSHTLDKVMKVVTKTGGLRATQTTRLLLQMI